MINNFSKFAVLGLCLSMLSFSSCNVIEMRDAVEETTRGEASTTMMLAPAERANDVEIRTEDTVSEVEETEQKKTLSFTATGDIRIDESMIADAANRASEGSTYSFLKIYSGVYRAVHDADVAVGRYSAAAAPYSCTDKMQRTPIESLAALSELGFEALDTTGAELSSKYADDMTEYDIVNLHSSQTGESSVYTVDRDGVTVAFLATDGSVKETMTDDIAYAEEIADVVVVSADWQDDMSTEDKRSLALTMAEAGADIIVGSGETLEGVEWLHVGDDEPTLAVYSLGNFVATADSADELCGGILSLDITLCNGELSLENVSVDPIIIHYNKSIRNYQIFELCSYTDEISATHGVEGVDVSSLKEKMYSLLDGFLPSDFRN